ncbi:MAG: sulfite exporter TauE/SafE family protein [Promethearchaeota archaeon]
MDILLLESVGIIGFVAGVASGLLGIGGGAIRIPLLNMMGFALISAFGMNLLSIPVSSLVGANSQKQNIDLRLGFYMILGGSIGTVLGTLIAFSIAASQLILAAVFVLASLVSIIGLNLNHISPNVSQHLRPSFTVLSFGSFFSNTLTGMRGGSEGSLFVPILKTFNVEMHKAIATALFAAIFTSLVGILLYWSQEHLLLLQGITVMVGSGIGALLGSKVSIKTKPKWLELLFSIVVIVLATLPLLKILFT